MYIYDKFEVDDATFMLLKKFNVYIGNQTLDYINYDNMLLLLEIARDEIKGYCNYRDDEILPTILDSAIIKLATVFYRRKSMEGMNQAMQGSRMSSFYNDIPADIKALCNPYRKIRVI